MELTLLRMAKQDLHAYGHSFIHSFHSCMPGTNYSLGTLLIGTGHPAMMLCSGVGLIWGVAQDSRGGDGFILVSERALAVNPTNPSGPLTPYQPAVGGD